MYEIHKLTGSVLVDGEGRSYGNESAGVISRHRTMEAAERRVRQLESDAMGRMLVEIRKQ